jgi:hypothetical protein
MCGADPGGDAAAVRAEDARESAADVPPATATATRTNREGADAPPATGPRRRRHRTSGRCRGVWRIETYFEPSRDDRHWAASQPWPADLDDRPMFVREIDLEAYFMRLRPGPTAKWLASKLEELARLALFLGAPDPETFEERLEVLERARRQRPLATPTPSQSEGDGEEVDR